METRRLRRFRPLAASCLLATIAAATPSPAREGAPPDRAELGPGKLLVASRELSDPNFRRTVVLIVEYGHRTGAVGLVINRPSEVGLASVLPELEGAERLDERVFIGGPVEPARFTLLVRASSAPEGSDRVLADVFVSGSRELLERLVATPGAGEAFRAYAGYAGWAPGQLEAEMAVGGWHLVDGRSALVFAQPTDELWSRLILIGTAEWARLPGSVPNGRVARPGR